jgi:glucosamine-phosphate N-acetyltransferase
MELVIRPLQIDDIHQEYFVVLGALSTIGTIDIEEAKKRFVAIDQNPLHTILVATIDGRIVANGSMLIELKFTHELGTVAHIEDIVVHPDFQGQGIAKKVLHALLQIAKDNGCYKAILDCSDALTPWYAGVEYAGQSFFKNGSAMRMNLV